jgi:hypothetical protein
LRRKVRYDLWKCNGDHYGESLCNVITESFQVQKLTLFSGYLIVGLPGLYKQGVLTISFYCQLNLLIIQAWYVLHLKHDMMSSAR